MTWPGCPARFAVCNRLHLHVRHKSSFKNFPYPGTLYAQILNPLMNPLMMNPAYIATLSKRSHLFDEKDDYSEFYFGM